MIHREALAAKTLPICLNIVLQDAVKIVNFVKNSALNTSLFRNICLEMDAVQKNLLYHTEVRWLSKGNVLKRILDLKDEITETEERRHNGLICSGIESGFLNFAISVIFLKDSTL